MGFEQKYEHRDELLRAALDEFCSQGYAIASINRILEQAGMSKGQFYYHFSGKETLYLELVEWMIQRKREFFAAKPPPVAEDFFETLTLQIQAGVSFTKAHPNIERFSKSVLAERGNAIFDAVTDRFRFDPSGEMGQLVAYHYKQGEFRHDVPLEVVQSMVTGMVSHLSDLLDVNSGDELLVKLRYFTDFLRHGVGAEVSLDNEDTTDSRRS